MEKEITELEKQWAATIQKQDESQMDQFLADNYFCSPHLSFPSPQCLFFKAMCASKDIAAIGAQKLIQFLNFNSCLFAKP